MAERMKPMLFMMIMISVAVLVCLRYGGAPPDGVYHPLAGGPRPVADCWLPFADRGFALVSPEAKRNGSTFYWKLTSYDMTTTMMIVIIII